MIYRIYHKSTCYLIYSIYQNPSWYLIYRIYLKSTWNLIYSIYQESKSWHAICMCASRPRGVRRGLPTPPSPRGGWFYLRLTHPAGVWANPHNTPAGSPRGGALGWPLSRLLAPPVGKYLGAALRPVGAIVGRLRGYCGLAPWALGSHPRGAPAGHPRGSTRFLLRVKIGTVFANATDVPKIFKIGIAAGLKPN